MTNGARHLLIVRTGSRLCAFPLDTVIESLRPQPVERFAAAPAYVLGIALIRGLPVPVIDLGWLLSGHGLADARRWVTLRLGRSPAAVSVDEVIGVRSVEDSSLQESPSLLGIVPAAARLGGLDSELLALLQVAQLISEEDWQRIEQGIQDCRHEQN